MLVNLRPVPRRRTSGTNGDDGGAALISVLIVALVLGIVAVGLSAAVVNTTLTTADVRTSLQAQAAADAGMAAAVASAKTGDACAASVPPGNVPGTGGGATYTATIACDAGHTTATLTATGRANGTSETVRAVYRLVPDTREVADPSHTPVGLVLYDASTMGQVTLLAHEGNEPQIVSVTGTFGCRLTVPGNLLVGGNVVSSDGCNVTGDIYTGGTVTFAGGPTTVLGDILAAGTGVSKINSAIGSATAGAPLSSVRVNGALDLLWSGARLHANVTAKGAVTVNDRVVDGSVTLPTGETPSINGGRIAGGVVNSSSISPVPAPTIPGWFDYAYKQSDWPGAAVITLQETRTMSTTSCRYFNENNGTYANQGWKDLANYTGTVVVDARACDQLTSNAGGNPAPVIKAANVVLLAKKFNTTGLTMRSAAGASPKVWFITEDTVANGVPSCPFGATDTNFDTNGANLEGVRSLIYTPCRLSVSGGGVLLGSLYTNGFNSGGQITIKGELMSLPGMPAPDGGYGGTPTVVQTGTYTLGTVVSRRDVG
jgi:Tfp pilus assembly protein PilV